MNKMKQYFRAESVVIAVLLLGVFCLFPSRASAQTPPPSVADRIEITPAGGINFYKDNARQVRLLAISPNGSLIAGGVSKGTSAPPPTNTPLTVNPVEYDQGGAGAARNWVHDFYFGRFVHGEGQPRLYSRGMVLWGRGESPDIQLGRTGPDNTECNHTPRHDPPGSHQNPLCQPTQYGSSSDTTGGTSLGKIVFVNRSAEQFEGDLAGITARNDGIGNALQNPGSLHFGTAGETAFRSTGDSAYDQVKKNKARRDGPERIVIKPNGNVGIGDEPNVYEKLHVNGKILASNRIKAKQDFEIIGNVNVGYNVGVDGILNVSGAKQFVISHPTKAGKKLAHAVMEGPEAAVYYRGEALLVNGRSEISLPDYFEALVRKGERTVLLTSMDGSEQLAVERQSGVLVKDGKFVVVSENAGSSQAFSWEVKAVRADVAPLQVEQ